MNLKDYDFKTIKTRAKIKSLKKPKLIKKINPENSRAILVNLLTLLGSPENPIQLTIDPTCGLNEPTPEY